MARITLEELYRGEGAGAKYGGIMNRAAAELLTQGHPAGYDEQTWMELLLVKHTLIAAQQMTAEGDCISDLSESQPPSFLYSYSVVSSNLPSQDN